MSVEDLYAAQVAVDPESDTLIADAPVQVFAKDDRSRETPLRVFEPASGVEIPLLRSNRYGIIQQIRVEGDPAEVVFKSGPYEVEAQSKFGVLFEFGLTPENIAAAVAAPNAAAEAGAAQVAIAASHAATATTAAATASTASAEAQAASTTAASAAALVAEVEATSDGIMTAVAGDPTSAFNARLSTGIAAAVAAGVPVEVAAAIAEDSTVVTAAAVAVSAEVAGRDLAEVKWAPDDVAFAIVDEDNRRNFLEFDFAGAPTSYARSLLMAALGPELLAQASAATGLQDQDAAVTGLGFVVVDEDGRRTEIEVGVDGRFTQRVIDSIASRIVVPTPPDPIRLILPSTLRLLQGQAYRLNFSSVIRALGADHRIRVTGVPGGSGNLGTHWQLTPTAAGSWTMTIAVLDRAGAVVLTASTPVVVYAPTNAPTCRLLAIGDSITRPNVYNAQAAAMVGGVTRGTRTYDNGGSRGEGRGGWSLAGYFTNIGHEQWGDSPFMFPVGVAGEKFLGATEFWRKVCYDDPNGYDYQGFQKIARGWGEASAPFLFNAQGYPVAPTEGDVVVDATFAEADEFRQYVSGAWVRMDPQPAVEFSFSKYMARYAAAFADGAPTAISMMLFTNDWFNQLTDATWLEWETRVKTVITSIRAWNATIPIVLIAAPTGGPDALWAAQTVNKVDFDGRMRDAATRLGNAFDTSAMRANYVHVISFLGAVAPENMADYVHPKSPEGMAQFAPWLAGKLAHIINGGA